MLFIYKDISASFEAAVCMAKLGRFSAMIDFIKTRDDLASQSPDIYFKILEECPSIELANEIMENSTMENFKIPIDKIVSILLDSDQPENGLKFLKVQIQKNSQTEDKNENLKKLKASYETLMKFSFLTREDDEFTKSIARESRDQLQSILVANADANVSSNNTDTAQNRRTLYKDKGKSPTKSQKSMGGVALLEEDEEGEEED